MQPSISLNTQKDSDTKKCNNLVKEKYDFDEKPSADDKFEEQIVVNILNSVQYDQIKTEKPYLEPQTIDDEIKQENEDALQTAAEFDKINMAVTA